MAKYTSDAKLISGAGKAYKNWDNVEGVYAGLDKVVKAGTDLIKHGEKKNQELKDKKAKEEQEAKDLAAKQEVVKKNATRYYNNQADKIIINSGVVGDKLYNFTTEVAENFKVPYLKGVVENDNVKRREGLGGLSGHNTWVKNHVALNNFHAKNTKEETYSKYYSENPQGMRDRELRGKISSGEVDYEQDDDGNYHYNVTVDTTDENSPFYGDKKAVVTVTDAQYKDFGIPKNETVALNFDKLSAQLNKTDKFDADLAASAIKDFLPKDDNEFVAIMYDDIHGKNFKEMLKTSESLTQEIVNALGGGSGGDGGGWDDNKDGVLDKDELDNFIDAATNPENNFFELDVSKKIMEDQLVNAAEQKHNTKYSKGDGDGENLDDITVPN